MSKDTRILIVFAVVFTALCVYGVRSCVKAESERNIYDNQVVLDKYYTEYDDCQTCRQFYIETIKSKFELKKDVYAGISVGDTISFVADGRLYIRGILKIKPGPRKKYQITLGCLRIIAYFW